MKISIVIASGSTELNAHVRINCLWRCVNSLHEDPGHPFELILIDNSKTEDHRQAIATIYDTYRSITHVIKNRINERHGGAMRQGLFVADGDILVTMPDDVILAPRWLEVLVAPLIETDKPYIASLQKGPNVRARTRGQIEVDGRTYKLWTRAGHYTWAMRRQDMEKMGTWKRKHFADTRMANTAQRLGYLWTVPLPDRYIKHSNLNFLRCWNYRNKRSAQFDKFDYLETVWKDVVTKEPERPSERFPLKGLPEPEELTGEDS